MRKLMCAALVVCLCLSGCAVRTELQDETPIVLGDELVALADSPVTSAEFLPEHPGVKVKSNADAEIDYSNAADGYVMVRYKTTTSVKLKAQVKGPTTTYTYNVTAGEWIAFPLSDGKGEYKVTVLKNTTGNKYAQVLSQTVKYEPKDEFAPFLYSNQYVDFAPAVNTVAKAKELIGGETDTLKQIQVVYDYVVNNFTYDKEKAATVKSGYLPVLDEVLRSKKGICFDYAALMAGMLRSQGVPCKLVVGYAGTQYHAWISVWSPEHGWLDGAIYFNGSQWQRLDPTFASTGNSSQKIIDYIKNDSNYTIKYLY